MAEEWARGEAEYFDRIRVQGFMLVLGSRADAACERLDKAVNALHRARAAAERALADARRETEFAELYGRMVGRGDSDDYAEIAALLEEQFG